MVPNKAKTNLFNTYNQTPKIINIFIQLVKLMEKRRKLAIFAKGLSGNGQALFWLIWRFNVYSRTIRQLKPSIVISVNS
jgi:hypothetical protein